MDVENVFDVPWNDHISYGEVRHRDEFEFSKYYFEIADIDRYFRFFDEFEDEVQRLMEADLVLPAYENCLKCSHIFNILDARGAVSATERVQIIARVRKLLSRVARSYLESREKRGFPLLRGMRVSNEQ